MARRLHADRRGISPVVATVILVAVTIVVAVAVAYWMGGLTAIYTRFEKLEITSAPVDVIENFTDVQELANVKEWNTSSGWKITVNVKNSGSADATIDNILINGKPWDAYSDRVKIFVSNNEQTKINVPVKAGDAEEIVIYIKADGAPFTSGTSIDIRLHTAAGQEYPKQVTLT